VGAHRHCPLILKVVSQKDLQKRDYLANPFSEEGL